MTTSRYWIISTQKGRGYGSAKTKKEARKKVDRISEKLPYRTKIQLFDIKTQRFTRFKRGKLY